MFEEYKNNFDDNEYIELNDTEVIQILKKSPKRINDIYFKQRVLKILNNNTFFNNNTDRNNKTSCSSTLINN